MPDPIDYRAMVDQANRAAKPVGDFLQRYDPLTLINQLARHTTGDLFFPKDRLLRFRKMRAEQEQAARDVQPMLRQMQQNQPLPPEIFFMPERLGTRP